MMIDACAFPVSQEAAFTTEEENIIKARMFTLLSKQVRLRTQGDHSSLREEDAAELLDSLLFTLRYLLFLRGMPLRTLLTADLNVLLLEGQAALQACVDGARALYDEALLSVKTFSSHSLSDTLKGIGLFFRAYDLRLYAHRIPAEIDYPLCLPVEDGLRGVLYIQAYLERLLTENRLVTRFAPECVSALLDRASPDYRELLLNLYDPIAANAVGLSLLGCDQASLHMTPEQAAEIHARLGALPHADARQCLGKAAGTVCDQLKLTGEQSRCYLRQAAEALYPRLIISPQSACGVFSACQ